MAAGSFVVGAPCSAAAAQIHGGAILCLLIIYGVPACCCVQVWACACHRLADSLVILCTHANAFLFFFFFSVKGIMLCK
jgi:hypothetical protein